MSARRWACEGRRFLGDWPRRGPRRKVAEPRTGAGTWRTCEATTGAASSTTILTRTGASRARGLGLVRGRGVRRGALGSKPASRFHESPRLPAGTEAQGGVGLADCAAIDRTEASDRVS